MESLPSSPCSLPVTPPFSPLVGGCNEDFSTSQHATQSHGGAVPGSKPASASREASLLGVMKVSVPLLSKEDAIEREQRFLNERMQALKKQNLERRQRAAARHRLMLATIERERAAALADRHKRVQAGKILLQRGLAAAAGSGAPVKSSAKRGPSGSSCESQLRTPADVPRHQPSGHTNKHLPAHTQANSGQMPVCRNSLGLPPLPCKAVKERVLPGCLDDSQVRSGGGLARQARGIKEVTRTSHLPSLRCPAPPKEPSRPCRRWSSDARVQECGSFPSYAGTSSSPAGGSAILSAASAAEAEQNWLHGGSSGAAAKPSGCSGSGHAASNASPESKPHCCLTNSQVSVPKQTQRSRKLDTTEKLASAARRADYRWRDETEQADDSPCPGTGFRPNQLGFGAALPASEHGACCGLWRANSAECGLVTVAQRKPCSLPRQGSGHTAVGEYCRASSLTCPQCMNTVDSKQDGTGQTFLTEESSHRGRGCQEPHQVLPEYCREGGGTARR